MMRKFTGVALFVCLVGLIAAAQEVPKPEVFGGFQFTSLDSGWHGSGWNGAASMYVTRWFGITGDFSGVYGTGSSFTTYTAGPVVSTHKGMVSPFAHALFGGAHVSSAGIGDSGMAMMFGGGVDIGNKKLAFRLGQLDWMMTHFNGFTDKNNMRVSTGALFRF
jgi:hypothetical protein